MSFANVYDNYDHLKKLLGLGAGDNAHDHLKDNPLPKVQFYRIFSEYIELYIGKDKDEPDKF